MAAVDPDDERIDAEIPVRAKPLPDPLTRAPAAPAPRVNPLLGNAFVEVHSYAAGRRDITAWCQRATWTVTTGEPWTTIDVSMILPWANRDQAPRAGDWLVVRDLTGRARAWGMVDVAPSPGIEGAPQGVRASRAISVRAVSWLTLLKRAQMFASPYAIAGRRTSVGTYFNAADWLAEVMSLADTIVSGTLGPGLATAISRLAKLRLPASLGGGLLADMVRVVYDTESARNAGLDRLLCAPVKGPRQLDVNSLFPSSSNTLDVLLGMFVPDRQFVEFWETLGPVTKPGDAATEALGAVPTLVYRIRPWQTEPLSTWLSRDSTTVGANDPTSPVTQSTPTPAATTPTGALTADQALVATFDQVTWNPRLGSVLMVDDDKIDFPTPTRSDNERVNMVTVGLPTQADHPARFWSEVGLPFMDAQSVERWGVRLFQPNWPYFPPSATKAKANSTLGSALQQGLAGATRGALGRAADPGGAEPTLAGFIRTIAGLAAMMFLGRERFYRGQFTTGTLRNDVTIGTPITIIWPQGFTFTAYVESVTANVDFAGPNGACNGYLTIGYSRGLYNSPEGRDSSERQAIAVATPKPVAPQKSPAKTAAPAVCHKGKRAAAWPTSLDAVVENDYTRSLQTWALTRGFKASNFGATGSEQWKHVMVSAACARVIEYYWRQQTPSATIRVLSSVRPADAVNDPNGNHSSGSSIDFTIMAPTPLGALQTWGALFRLSGSGRIPLGGRGLYLNVSAGGITGTLPTDAGASSSTSKPAPGGSSAGVHYDYRNTFGFRPGAPANKWLGLDTTGDGTDDYMIGGVRSAETLPYLTLHRPTVAAYYENQGVNDPALLQVSDTVPNALQMLGIEEWCSP